MCLYFGRELGYAVTGVDNNQRAVFFGPQGDTRWNEERLKRELGGFVHHELDIRDRRLMTIGVLAALDQPQLMEIQFRSALERGELTEEQVRETVLHLTHYIGWPLSTEINAAAERVIAQRSRDGAS